VSAGGAVLIALLQSNVPAFGSHYAGKQFFAAKQSDIMPSATAHCESDERVGGQRAGAGPIRVVPFAPQEAKPYDFPHDVFHVVLSRNGRAEKVADVEAAYGTCDVYAVDLDGDQEPEVVVESGLGRGTSAYVRTLEIYKRRPNNYERVFYAPLSGYVPVGDADPDTWERSYSFKTARGPASVVLHLRLGPRSSVWADADALDALHFPVREYCWRTPPGAYRLCHFEYATVEK
jgi:hypothetical protein